MKKKYGIKIIALLAIIATISFSSCEKFLTSEMTDAVQSDVTYYKTPAQAFTALAGCYNGLNLIYNNGSLSPALIEVLSDNSFGGTGSNDGYGWQMIDEFDKTVSPSDVSMLSATWKSYYQTIYRCNVLLLNMDNVVWGDSIALKKQYTAEAKFIRAYCYLDMVRLWEKVPLLTTPTTENVPQADPALTYAQIMSDLRYAADSLPSKPYTSITGGRVTKWAAESLLARAYLFYSGYYGATTIGSESATTALAAVEDVIAHSGHGLVSDFNTLWPAASIGKKVSYADETNPEVVFAIKYSSTDNWSNGTGNHWMVMEGIRSQSIYPYQAGWGGCTVDPKLWNAFTPTDSRRFASILSVVDESLAYTKSGDCREYTGYFLKKYAMLCDESGTSIVTNFQTGQYQDFFVIRYSDVLLMAAELGSPSAVSYVNLVHQRADASAAPVGSVTKADILAERRLEFVGEGIRYWDLLRQGINVAASTIAANTTVSLFQDGTGNPPTASKLEASIKATHGFQQIPDDQITLSSGILIQNPGW